MQAIEYEAQRHIDVYEDGGDIVQETRLFDPSRGETRAMRSKEHAHDYRYFPDPDLLPLELSDDLIDSIRKTLPELPDQKKVRFVGSYGLTPYDAGVLVMEKETATYFESAAQGRDGKQVANWLITTLFGGLNKKGLSIAQSPIRPAQLGQLVDLISDNTISGRLAKDVFEIMMEEGKDPAVIVEERGLKQVTDTHAINRLVMLSSRPIRTRLKKSATEKRNWWPGLSAR